MMTMHGMAISGNCYKLRLLFEQLGLPHRWVEVDSVHGETRTPEFLAKNPNGRVPVLELEDGRTLSESNAILCYLADDTPFLPADRWQRAKVMQWLFFEQYSHEPYLAVARFIQFYLGLPEDRLDEYKKLQKGGHKALRVMEKQLQLTPYLVGDEYSIADVALYAYTHVAHEGGFDLSGYPAIQAWLKRVASHPRHVTMLG